MRHGAPTSETITLNVPMTFRRRGRRKLVVAPDWNGSAPQSCVENAMIKALARAFWWRKVLDEGVYATLDDLAKARGIGKAYVSQVLRLTLLAPDMVEAILERRQPPELQLNDLLAGFPPHWKHQIENFGTLTRSGDTKLDQSIDAIKAAA